MTTHADCVFCALLNGQIPASIVFRDERVMAVMTIRPAHAGHLLLFPRTHVEAFEHLDDTTRSHLFQIAAELKSAICEAVPCAGFQLLLNHGEATGQKEDCRHLHLHLIPRSMGDGVDLAGRHAEAPRTQLDETAFRIALRMKANRSRRV